jgi:hypothetical protein
MNEVLWLRVLLRVRKGWHISHDPCTCGSVQSPPSAPQTVGRTAFSVHIVSLNKTVATPLPPRRAPESLLSAPLDCSFSLSLLSLRVRAHDKVGTFSPLYGTTLWPAWAPQIVGRAAVSVPCFSQSVATPVPPWRAPRSLPHVTAHFLSLLSSRVRAPRAHDKVGTFSTTPVCMGPRYGHPDRSQTVAVSVPCLTQ